MKSLDLFSGNGPQSDPFEGLQPASKVLHDLPGI